MKKFLPALVIVSTLIWAPGPVFSAPDTARGGGTISEIDTNGYEFMSLAGIGDIIPASDIFQASEGTVCLWMKFQADHPVGDHVIFHTDDSRYILYVDTYYSQGAARTIVRIAARAGGNQRFVDSGFQRGNFPEASIIVDNDGTLQDYGKNTPWYSPAPFPAGEWHHVAMTWQGYPEGTVRIYLDAVLMGEKVYGSGYDNGAPLPASIAIGFRPADWPGEMVMGAGGMIMEMVPKSAMRLSDGGIGIMDLRLYKEAVPGELLVNLLRENRWVLRSMKFQSDTSR